MQIESTDKSKIDTKEEYGPITIQLCISVTKNALNERFFEKKSSNSRKFYIFASVFIEIQDIIGSASSNHHLDNNEPNITTLERVRLAQTFLSKL